MPKLIRNRKSKIAFKTPNDFLLNKNIIIFIEDIINSNFFLKNNIFDGKKINKIIQKKINNKVNILEDRSIWRYIQTSILMEQIKSNNKII